MIRRRDAVPLRGVVVVLTAIALAAGCTSPVAGPAQFGSDGGDRFAVCAPADSGEDLLFGEVITAPQGRDITIREVTLDDADGVRLVKSILIPVYPETGIYGIGSATVPPDPVPPGWDKRVDASGATVAADTLADIVVQVERTSDEPGSFSAVHVRYSAGGLSFEKSASTSYTLESICD